MKRSDRWSTRQFRQSSWKRVWPMGVASGNPSYYNSTKFLNSVRVWAASRIVPPLVFGEEDSLNRRTVLSMMVLTSKLQPFMLLNGHWFSFLVSTFLVVSCLANSNVSKCTSLNILAGEFPTTRMCASFVVQVLIFRYLLGLRQNMTFLWAAHTHINLPVLWQLKFPWMGA